MEIYMAWDWDKLQQQKRSSGGGAVPPQMGEVFNKIKGARGKFPALWVIVIVAFVLYLGASMVYTVGVDEVGIIQRFGKYERTTRQGLNFKLPAGIEKLTKVKVTVVYREEFGFGGARMDGRSRLAAGGSAQDASLMLTGDLNVALVPWIVQYRIQDPYKYLFKVQNVTGTLRDLSEAVMRQVVGDRSINEVISKREEIATQAQSLLQKELDVAETGISISTIELQRTNVPEPVQPSFNEVNQATQEKERMIYQAREEYNKVIPQARGDAEKLLREAEGYAMDRVNRSKGDAARFLSLYEEYVKAEDVTRRRLYLEALREVLPKLGSKYIVDAEQKNFLPLLNLAPSKGGQK
jgi:membrane protease subunit HflK